MGAQGVTWEFTEAKPEGGRGGLTKLSNSYKVFTDRQAEDCELFESLKPMVGSSIQLQVWIFWSSTGATEDLVRGPVRSSLEEATCSVSGKLLVARWVWSGEGLG